MTFDGDSRLPVLEVPSLEETLEELLVQTLACAESAEEYASLARLVAEALKSGSDVRVAQNRLVSRAKWAQSTDGRAVGTHGSWLLGWWTRESYLSFRKSVALHVSYFFLLEHVPDAVLHAGSAAQVLRAASLSCSALKVRDSLVRNDLRADMHGKSRLDMSEYRLVLHTAREARAGSDWTRGWWRSVLRGSGSSAERVRDAHLVPSVSSVAERLWSRPELLVLRNGHLWLVPVYRKSGSEDEWDFVRLVDSLNEVVRRSVGKVGPNVGFLTGMDRDAWAEQREVVEKGLLVEGLGGGRYAWERVVEQTAFAVCLDRVSGDVDQMSSYLLRGGDRCDRWWDKSMQLVVFPDGQAGWIGEHSRVDGTTGAGFVSRVVAEEKSMDLSLTRSSFERRRDDTRVVSPPSTESLRRIHIAASELSELEPCIERAIRFRRSEAKRHVSLAVRFEEFGKSFPKSVGISPDAWAQIAMLLAWHLASGKPTTAKLPPTYEPAQTRRFQGGRTETIRTKSTQICRFVESLTNPETPTSTKKSLLHKAAKEHSRRSARASNGYGIDRHLLGLGLAASELRSPAGFHLLNSLLQHPLVKQSSTWVLSTSNLSDPAFRNWGWGNVTPEGVGIAYAVLDSGFLFNVVSCVDTPPPPPADNTTSRSAAGFALSSSIQGLQSSLAHSIASNLPHALRLMHSLFQ